MIELIYLIFNTFWLGSLQLSDNSSSIGHMVNSDTNVKYTIVHNITFILLVCVGERAGGEGRHRCVSLVV